MEFVSQQISQGSEVTTNYTPTPQEEETVKFAKRILAGTEDVWTPIFSKNGMTYKAPRMVTFSSSTTSGCGGASSSTGPFYCPADQTIYIDLSFMWNSRIWHLLVSRSKIPLKMVGLYRLLSKSKW